MPSRFAALAFAVAASASAAAPGGPGSPPYFLNDPALWGTLSRVVPPDYPKEALAGKQTGYVDVTGRVTWAEVLEEIEYRPDTPASAIFAGAIAEVIRHWRFHAGTGNDCLPSDKRVTARVWFELDGDKPKISITQAAPDQREKSAEFTTTHRVLPSYPLSMQRRSWQAYVFARLEIDAQGNVVAATAAAFPRQARVNLERFEQETTQSLSQWKFPAASPERKSNRVACYSVLFRLKD